MYCLDTGTLLWCLMGFVILFRMNITLTHIYIKWVRADPSTILGNQFSLKNARKLRLHVFFYFVARKHISQFFRIHKKLWILFLFSLSPQGSIIWTKITISCEFRALRVKLWFSRMKMEEYMESELSSIFGVKLFPKNIVFGCLGVSELSLQCTVSLKKSANFLRQAVRL